MHPLRRKRLILILFIILGVGGAVALALSALQQNINLFYTPSQIVAGEVPEQARIRAGGMVVEGSVKRSKESLEVLFDVSDGTHAVTVGYSGILPDLFREGQGIVALGRVDANGVLQADEVLAKHDEEYMPPEVAKAMNDAKAKKAAAAGGAPTSEY